MFSCLICLNDEIDYDWLKILKKIFNEWLVNYYIRLLLQKRCNINIAVARGDQNPSKDFSIWNILVLAKSIDFFEYSSFSFQK